jgi:hypothetical protein
MRKGEELKAPRHASAAATRDRNLPSRDGSLPYLTATCLIPDTVTVLGRHLPYSTNQDFPSPGWKIAIGSLTTSALAALATCLPAAPERFFFFFFSLA